MLLSSKMSSCRAYWVIYPAHAMPNVILILSLEDQPPVCVVLLGQTIELSVHIGALENSPVLVGVNALALQGIVHVIPLQGAVREGEQKGSSGRDSTLQKERIMLCVCSGQKERITSENHGPVLGTTSRRLLDC